MDKKGYIKQFIDGMKELYGDIPKFIHTNKEGHVNYSGPTFDDNEIIAAIEAIMFGTWASSGELVRKFEQEFSEKFGFSDSLMVNSGSSANLVMITALKEYYKWQDGDEVILSVVGFPTTLSPLMVNNLKPVFVDIEFDSLNFDISLIEEKISVNTKAIFISPVLGNPPDMDKLIEIARKHDIILILDNCDSLGSMWNDKYLSEYCVASSCSFYPAHHLTTLEGGMVSSNNKTLIKTARSIASWGRSCTCIGTDNLLPKGACGSRFNKWLPNQDIIIDHKYIFNHIGYNLKPIDMLGAIGSEQLKKFDDIAEKRRGHKVLIDAMLTALVPEVRLIGELYDADTCWFGVPIVCPDKEYKERFVAHLEENHVQTRNYFAGNILHHGAYSHLDDWGKYPEANKVLEQVLFIGCSPNYTKESFEHIQNTLESWKQ